MVYESLTSHLREATRDKKQYPFVLRELTHYGFLRNLWGLRGAAVVFAGVSVVLTAAWAALSGPWVWSIRCVAPAINVLAIILWAWWPDRTAVRDAAEAYAKALLTAGFKMAEDEPGEGTRKEDATRSQDSCRPRALVGAPRHDYLRQQTASEALPGRSAHRQQTVVRLNVPPSPNGESRLPGLSAPSPNGGLEAGDTVSKRSAWRPGSVAALAGTVSKWYSRALPVLMTVSKRLSPPSSRPEQDYQLSSGQQFGHEDLRLREHQRADSV